MRDTRILAAAILAMLLFACFGCQRLMNQDAAIQKAVRDHLGERSDLDMRQMVMEMQQVKVDGDKAQAEVVFRATSSPPAQMAYHYDLHREGGAWKVDTGRPSGTQHPPMGESAGEASGGDSMGDGQATSGELPAGHPPITQTNPHGAAPGASEPAPPSPQQ